MPVAILDDCYRMESSWFTQGHPLRGLGSAGVIPGMFCIGKPGELLVCLGLTPPSYGVSPLQGLVSCAFIHLGAYATKLWSVAPPGLSLVRICMSWGLRHQAMGCRPSRALGFIPANEGLRNAAHCCEPSLYYFAHKELSHRHQSVHSVNSLENRSCSFPSSRKSAFH